LLVTLIIANNAHKLTNCLL